LFVLDDMCFIVLTGNDMIRYKCLHYIAKKNVCIICALVIWIAYISDGTRIIIKFGQKKFATYL